MNIKKKKDKTLLICHKLTEEHFEKFKIFCDTLKKIHEETIKENNKLKQI